MALADCLISVYSHISTASTHCQLRAQLLIFREAGLQAVSQSAVTKYRAARRPRSRVSYRTTGPHAIHCLMFISPSQRLQFKTFITYIM